MGIEKRRSTLSVLFYIKRQKLLKNGEAPVCMRITVDKRKAEIMIKRSVPVELWNQSSDSHRLLISAVTCSRTSGLIRRITGNSIFFKFIRKAV